MNRRGWRGLHRRNQTHFPNSMSDRRMQALQILNTLCTLPLEKMNTFLLTCLYLSFTLYTHIPYIHSPTLNPLPQPPPVMQIDGDLPQISFYNINCIFFQIGQLTPKVCNETVHFVSRKLRDVIL